VVRGISGQLNVIETALQGVLILEPELIEDSRGFFARTWEADALIARGLDASLSEASTSWNEAKGTLRGLHYQTEPFSEAKTVTCVSGAIWDVAVDLRQDSPTRHQWFGVELTATSRRSVYIPRGCAHGFLTLTDNAEVRYLVSARYRPDAQAGVRWNDPTLAIRWPAVVMQISDRDNSLPFVEVSR
jgi:dTDP-4-dehydrorhamnose 3,5-epimerase